MTDEQKMKRGLPIVEVVPGPEKEKVEAAVSSVPRSNLKIYSEERKPAEKKVVTAVAPPVASKKGCGFFYWLMLLVMFGLGAMGGFWWGSQMKNTNVALFQSPTPVLTTGPTPLPTPTPVPLNPATVTVEVLNGSGRVGYAGEVMEKLVVLGYQEGKVGNAVANDKTRLLLSDDLAEFSEQIKTDMETVVEVVEVDEEALEGSGSARLILGSD
jgi:hypothetical protein